MGNGKDFGSRDALVVGGGVIGLAVARALARKGFSSVALVERGRVGAEASWAAAGMLAPQAEADRRDEFFDLLCASRAMYPAFADELREETGIDIELDRTGTLYLALTESDEREVERRYEWQARAGLAVERLSAAAAREVEPAISEGVRMALRFPTDWQVENRRLVAALGASAEAQGVRLLTGVEVTSILVERGRVRGVETSCGTFQAGVVVLAAGAWSSLIQLHDAASGAETIYRHSAACPRVEPVRGQMLCFDARPPLVRHVVYSPRGYVVPRRDGRLLAGSTTERAGYDKSLTDEGVRQIAEHAREIAPSTGSLALVDSWAGLRPRAGDDWPVLGAAVEIENLYCATGHYRNGILLAPLTGKAIAGLVTGSDALINRRALETFSPARFHRVAVGSNG